MKRRSSGGSRSRSRSRSRRRRRCSSGSDSSSISNDNDPRPKHQKTLESGGDSDGYGSNSGNESGSDCGENTGPDRWELSTTIDDDQGVLDLIAEYQRGEEAGYPEPDPALERVLVRAVGERSVPLVAGCFGDTSDLQARQNEFMLSVGRALFAGIPGRPSPNQAALCGRLIRALLPPVLQAPASAAFTEGIVQDAECSFSRSRGKLPASLLPDLIAAATSSPFLSVARQRALIALAVQSAEAVRATGASDLPARLAVACAEAPLNVAAAARSSAFMGNAPTTFQSRMPACAAEWYVASGRILYFVLAQGAKAAERKDSVVRALSHAFVARPILADSAAACLCQASFAANSSAAAASSASPFVVPDDLDEGEDVADDPAALAAFLFCATAHMGMGGPRLSAERVLARVLARLPGKKPALIAAGTTAAFSARAFALLLALADRLCSSGSGALAVAVLRHAATTATGADDHERVPGLKLRTFLSLLRYAGLGVEPFSAVCGALEALSQQCHTILEGSGNGVPAGATEIESALHECLRDRAPTLSASSCYALVSSVTPLLARAPGLLSAVLEDIYALETEHFEHGVAGICALLGRVPGPHAPALVSELTSCWSATKGDSACVAFFLKHLSSVVPSILEVAAADPQAALFVDEILGQFLLVCRARETIITTATTTTTGRNDGDENDDNNNDDGFYWVLDYGFLRSQTPCFIALLWCCCNAVLALEDDSARSRAFRSGGIENYSRVADILGSICKDLGRGAASNGLRDMLAALDEDPTLASALSLVATLLAAFAWSRAGGRSSSVPPALPILDAAAAFNVKAAEVYAALTRVDLSEDGAADALPSDLAESLIPPGTELSALPASAVGLIVSLAYEVLLGSSKDKRALERDDFFGKNCTYLTVARCLELASRWGEPYLNLKNMCLVSWSTFTRASAYSAPTAAISPAVVFNDVQTLILRSGKQQKQQAPRKLDQVGLVRSLQVTALGAIADIINTNGQLFANLSRAVSLLTGIVEYLCADVADRSKASRRAKCEINVSLLQAYSAVLQSLCKVIPARARTPALLHLWTVLDPLSSSSAASDPSKKLSLSPSTSQQGSKAPSLAISTSLVVVQLLLDYLPKKENVTAVKALIGHCVPEFAAQRRGALFSSWCVDGENNDDENYEEEGGKEGAMKGAKTHKIVKAIKPLQVISIAPWSKAFSLQVVSKCLSTLIRFVPQDDGDDSSSSSNDGNSLPLLGNATESEVQTFLCICSVASYFLEAKTSSWDSRIESRVTSLAAKLLSAMERHLAALCKEIEEINSLLSTNNSSSAPPLFGVNGAKAGTDRNEVDVEQIEKARAEIQGRAKRIARFFPHFKAFASLTVEHNSKVRSGTEEQNLAKKVNEEVAVISKFLEHGKDTVEGINNGSNDEKHTNTKKKDDDDDEEGGGKRQKPVRGNKRLKQQRSKRSRNAFIDANLTTGMDDTYADLEDFIVCAPNTQYSAQETERELDSKTKGRRKRTKKDEKGLRT